MAFRWKDYDTPEQAMQGYVPNSAAAPQGYRPNVAPAMPYNNEQIAQQNLDQFNVAEQKRQQIQTKINALEAELADVTAKIEAIDKESPSLKNNPKEWEIAAKRAEIGDMSAYDNLVSRGGGSVADSSGIENELYNAEKLTWGLSSKSDEDRRIAAANINASLRKAEEWAARSGGVLPPSYDRLKKALADSKDGSSDDMNAREYGNEIALKIYRGTATDDDIERGVKWAEKNPNSDAAKEILEAAKAGKGGTIEAKARAAQAKREAENAKNGFIESVKGLPKAERIRLWNEAVKKDAKLKRFTFDGDNFAEK